MIRKIGASTVVASLMMFGAAPAAFSESRGANNEDLTIEIADNPQVSLGGQSVELTEIKDEVGEKHYSGKSKTEDLVRVILFEKPAEPVVEPPAVEETFDWTQTASPDNPTLVKEVIPRGEAPEPSASMEPSIVTAATDSTISIAWFPEEEAVGYDVYRDGVLHTRTSEPEFSVNNLAPDTSYVFEIKSDFEAEADGSSPKVEKTVPVETLANESVASKSEVAPLTYQPYNTAFTYETFIPPAQVSLNVEGAAACGAFGVPGITFGGDNRSYRTPGAAAPYDTPDYRTMMFTNINWDNVAPYDVINMKGLRPTTKYKDGRPVETRTASMDQMRFTEIQKGGSYAQVRYDHAAGNPFCSVGNIRYNVVNRFYRSGLVETVGYRQKAPAHEAYARFNNTGSGFWVTMFRLPNESFNCLFEPSCATQTINYRQER